jgi:hypothetical protein
MRWIAKFLLGSVAVQELKVLPQSQKIVQKFSVVLPRWPYLLDMLDH